MGFVLDASVTLAWCFQDEATPATAKLLDILENETAFVPGIWPLEVGNILIGATQYKRISHAEVSLFLSLLNSVNIQIDSETASRGFQEIFFLAHNEKLTTYDSAYLELAMRLDLPLATKDKQLIKIAHRLGVKTLGTE